MDATNAIRKNRVTFPGISSKTWEHPADRAALTALRKVPGLDLLLQKLIGATTEKSLRLLTLASAVRVTETQFPRVNRLYRDACGVLDVTERPELFVSQSPFLNAGAIGVDHPFIVLNSSLVESVGDEELLSVIAHELGHCLSGHVLYKTLLAILVRFSTLAFSVPLGGASLLAIIMALREWDRKSELSADRAGLLVVQDPQVSYSLLMKLIGQTHPFPVLRLTELKGWVDRGEYGTILEGEYRHRTQDEADDVRDTFRRAADQYREDFNASKDPLADILRNAGSAANTASQKAREMFDALFSDRK